MNTVSPDFWGNKQAGDMGNSIKKEDISDVSHVVPSSALPEKDCNVDPCAPFDMENVLKTQYGGQHYKTMPLQPWEIIEQLKLDFWEGNALKYLLRYKTKNGIGDLKKAIHYIEYLIARLGRQETKKE